MAGESNFWEDSFSSVLNAYRDVEVAKRSQPQIVQGFQQSASPVAYNAGAVVGASSGSFVEGQSTGMMIAAAALLLGGFIYLKKGR